ncbi:phosphoribosylaminoimidazolesuccinocarboxamide synthase [bacterium]|nr:phosphoribosylaminoimidazolesuccinocarboxamide synthase [bacterium]
MKDKVILKTNLKGLKLVKQGKVRDIYEIEDKYLIIATDRISAFDVVIPNGIPGKGVVLTQLSLFFLKYTKGLIDNHLITGNVDEFPQNLKKYKEILKGRSMLVKKAKPLPIECIVRGYITGSGWKDYLHSGQVCGIKLRKGLKESEKLNEVIFTPSTKADTGHDINISRDEAKKLITGKIFDKIEDVSIKIYNKGHEFLKKRGIILADTKLEFGIDNFGVVILIDEILTPDSSRFWPLNSYQPGRVQASFDKQYVRDFLENSGWNKKPPSPELPSEVVKNTSLKYNNILEIITGNV